MKIIFSIAAFFLLFVSATCNTGRSNGSTMKFTGEIEAIGMSSWQYGTHTLTNENTFYALKSEKIDLSKYEGKTVTVSAVKIEGYPLEGGPEFLNVVQVIE